MQLEEDVKLIRRPDKILVYSSKAGDLFQINQVAEFILIKLKEGLTKEKIIEELVKETKAIPDVAKKDVEDFLSLLKEKKILK